MTTPAHPGRLPAARVDRALVHPLLTALSAAGVPVRPGDLDQLQQAAALGPDFVHALARWIHTAHLAAGQPTENPLGALPEAGTAATAITAVDTPLGGRPRRYGPAPITPAAAPPDPAGRGRRAS
ncbi:hypothetical protein [Kitasatospora sp. NBC_00315]|uniref:hypothetical protein n=1 Tax=Kitasatospora sp. NBC_00315 TaxID=2975963 RepID=UPI003249045F